MSYSAMSTKIRNPYETLERMLNKTTLRTQRVAHSNIIGKILDYWALSEVISHWICKLSVCVADNIMYVRGIQAMVTIWAV